VIQIDGRDLELSPMRLDVTPRPAGTSLQLYTTSADPEAPSLYLDMLTPAASVEALQQTPWEYQVGHPDPEQSLQGLRLGQGRWLLQPVDVRISFEHQFEHQAGTWWITLDGRFARFDLEENPDHIVAHNQLTARFPVGVRVAEAVGNTD